MKQIKLMMSALIFVSACTQASLSVDRTRIIYDEKNKGVSVVVENTDKKDPYLMQTWVENAQGEKITEPLIALPLLQRIEPGQKKQVRINTSKNDLKMSTNEESLFYFNVLGIPPKSQLENAVEIVIQSRFKLFYRPEGLPQYLEKNWQKELKLEKSLGLLKLTNPTPYHVVVININDSFNKVPNFQEMVIKPNSHTTYPLTDKQQKSSKMVISYIDDFGSPHLLNYTCASTTCTLLAVKGK